MDKSDRKKYALLGKMVTDYVSIFSLLGVPESPTVKEELSKVSISQKFRFLTLTTELFGDVTLPQKLQAAVAILQQSFTSAPISKILFNGAQPFIEKVFMEFCLSDDSIAGKIAYLDFVIDLEFDENKVPPPPNSVESLPGRVLKTRWISFRKIKTLVKNQ